MYLYLFLTYYPYLRFTDSILLNPNFDLDIAFKT